MTRYSMKSITMKNRKWILLKFIAAASRLASKSLLWISSVIHSILVISQPTNRCSANKFHLNLNLFPVILMRTNNELDGKNGNEFKLISFGRLRFASYCLNYAYDCLLGRCIAGYQALYYCCCLHMRHIKNKLMFHIRLVRMGRWHERREVNHSS